MKTKTRSLISVALALLLLSGCAASQETGQNIIDDDYRNWYEIFVYSFCDSNGVGMLWTSPEETTTPPPGATKTEYPLPSVEEQLADENSLLNFYRSAMELRNRFPEIARGSSQLIDSGSGDVCLILRTWQDSSILIAINPSENDQDISADAFAQYSSLSGQLTCGTVSPSMNSGTLHLPAWSVAILTDIN